ncbi:MAG TPA: DUF3810 family protein [Verrucomicrobiae bacterium]|jgi:hypothetical protein|nr:DUF3810 family protein [Verrucomicrobiae bacterium]
MGGSFFRSRGFLVDTLAIAAAVVLLSIHPSAQWVERAYANGAYPIWQHAISAITLPLPFSLGDLAGVAGLAIAILIVAHNLRAMRKGRRLLPIARALYGLLALGAVYTGWFLLSWGLNYDRAPLETRTRYDASRVTLAAGRRLSDVARTNVNRLAAAAHARSGRPLDTDGLEASWLPVVRRLGDTWTPHVGAPKISIADPFMNATGTSGYINPLTLNSHLASDLLWFERPFDLAHEWTHVAAFAREDEANYVAVLTTTRSRDPVIAYSGWLEVFLTLPLKAHYKKTDFAPLVWSDFAAIRLRNARRLNLSLARFSWRTYNVYLKSNHVAAGVENYNEVARLLLAIPLDRQGLPIALNPPDR